jgi:hypothetical protein
VTRSDGTANGFVVHPADEVAELIGAAAEADRE